MNKEELRGVVCEKPLLCIGLYSLIYLISVQFVVDHDTWLKVAVSGILLIMTLVLSCYLAFHIVIDLVNKKSKTRDVPRLLRMLVYLLSVTLFSFSTLYYLFGVYGENGIVKNDWYVSAYFSIVTFTTLGYGDFKPVSTLRIVAATEAVVGYFYMAITVGAFIYAAIEEKEEGKFI